MHGAMYGIGPSYTYSRDRREFGRPTKLDMKGAQLVYDAAPNEALRASHVLVGLPAKGTQLSKSFSCHEAMTHKTPYKRRNDNQKDTGWPKEIYVNDPEQVIRYKKKQEKDERLIKLLPIFQKMVTNALDQNNAIDIYEEYFTTPDLDDLPELGPMWARTLNVFEPVYDPRLPVSSICWSPVESGDKVAVAHADLTFQKSNECGNCSYIWTVGNQISPYAVLQTPFQCTVLEFNEKDPQGMAGGLINGQVAYFDLRQANKPVSYSPVYTSFRDPVSSIVWTNSKTGTEFFSASTDGQIMWWDIRNLEEPVDAVLLDFTKGEDQEFGRAMGVSCLEFQPTIPTRYLVGTEAGVVLNGNRKGKTMQEKFGVPVASHIGPVRSIERNYSFLKNYITAGDWTVRIWSEDCKESSIIWTSFYKCELIKALWSPVKPSVFFVARNDGVLDAWDLILDQNKPACTTQISSRPLKTIRVHEDGQMIAVGDATGKTHIVEYSEHLYEIMDKGDKALVAALFDRETRREKIIETKIKESKLKAQQRVAEEVEDEAGKDELIAERAEHEFTKIIDLLNSGGVLKTGEDYDT